MAVDKIHRTTHNPDTNNLILDSENIIKLSIC